MFVVSIGFFVNEVFVVVLFSAVIEVIKFVFVVFACVFVLAGVVKHAVEFVCHGLLLPTVTDELAYSLAKT